MEGSARNLSIIKLILSHFASLSGLTVNDAKCLFVPIAIPDNHIEHLAAILGCAPKQLPITYLGLPLSIRRPARIHFKPLIDAFQKRLDGWKSNYLSLGGRLTLVKSVLTAIPLHYMQAIKLPAWLIKHLDGIRRRFFWKGRDKCLGGHCLVNWSKYCLPKNCGGLGVQNLSCQNQALLTKWLWKLKADPDSIWSSSIRHLYGTTDIAALAIDDRISPGLRDILQLNDFFSASIAPSPGPSSILWKWTPNGLFSSASAYGMLADPGIRCSYHGSLWKLKAPPKVKVFLWLVILDKILTQSNLVIRNWPTIQNCVCCNVGTFETSSHLFLSSDLARQIWTSLQLQFNLPSLTFTQDVLSFWQVNRSAFGKHWDIIWAAATWSIWKERNNRIFNSHSTPSSVLAMGINTVVNS